jgi:FixJ family two-component response regulator
MPRPIQHTTTSELGNSEPARRKSQHSKIYIVDDDESVLKALGRLVRSAGLNYQSFASGHELFAHLPADGTGCLIIDIQMPVSAQDDDESRNRARELGAVAFFRKPVDDQALLDAIVWPWVTRPALKRRFNLLANFLS